MSLRVFRLVRRQTSFLPILRWLILTSVGALIILELYLLLLFTPFTWRRSFRLTGSGVWLSPEWFWSPGGHGSSHDQGVRQLLRPLEVVLLLIGFAIIGLTVDAVRRAHPQGRDYLWVNLSLIVAFFTIYFFRLISSRLSRSLITYFQVFLFS